MQESRTYIEAKDILAVEFECAHCHATTTIPERAAAMHSPRGCSWTQLPSTPPSITRRPIRRTLTTTAISVAVEQPPVEAFFAQQGRARDGCEERRRGR